MQSSNLDSEKGQTSTTEDQRKRQGLEPAGLCSQQYLGLHEFRRWGWVSRNVQRGFSTALTAIILNIIISTALINMIHFGNTSLSIFSLSGYSVFSTKLSDAKSKTTSPSLCQQCPCYLQPLASLSASSPLSNACLFVSILGCLFTSIPCLSASGLDLHALTLCLHSWPSSSQLPPAYLHHLEPASSPLYSLPHCHYPGLTASH